MNLRWADYRPPAGSRAPSGRTPPGTVVYAIGDIHGRCDLLEAIRRGIAVDAKLRPARRKARDDATVELLRRRFAAALTPRELEFFRGLRLSHCEGSYHFVHAGVRPGVALDSQADHDQMWVRERFMNSGDDHGATVIHGHSIAAEPEIRANRIGIDTGAYRSGVLTCLVPDGTERAFLQT